MLKDKIEKLFEASYRDYDFNELAKLMQRALRKAGTDHNALNAELPDIRDVLITVDMDNPHLLHQIAQSLLKLKNPMATDKDIYKAAGWWYAVEHDDWSRVE